MDSSNVTPFPSNRMPEPLSAGEIDLAERVLTYADKSEPLGCLRVDEWAAIVRMAEMDLGQFTRLELRMKAAMNELKEGTGNKFTLHKLHLEAKQNAKAREQASRLVTRRRKANGDAAKAGTEDTVAVEIRDLPSDQQIDATSTSLTLLSRHWLTMNRRGRVWFDEFSNDVYSDWDGRLNDKVVTTRAVDDQWRLKAYISLMQGDVRLAKLGEKAAHNAVNSIAFDDRRNGPQEWVRRLAWDNVPRLDSWLSTVYGTPQDEYHKAVGRNWLVGIVARIHKPGDKMDHMPVLIGGEGIYKSTSLEILGGKLHQAQAEPHFYGAINVSAEKMTDFLMTLRGLMVAEIAELDALMNKRTEHSRVKTLITTTEDIYRAPYGHAPGIHLRTPVLSGTTNEFHWNNFEGIGRRFWPFECNRVIDTAWLIENREQLFAEAQAAYVAGERWDVVPKDQHQVQMQTHKIDDPMQDRIEGWLRKDGLFTGAGCGVNAVAPNEEAVEAWARWGTLITTSRILTEIMQIPLERQGSVTRKVSSVMHNLGWKSGAIRCGSGRDSSVVRGWTRNSGQLFDKTGE